MTQEFEEYYKLFHEASFKKLEVYSLRLEGEQESIFSKFRNNHLKQHRNKLIHLNSCIKQMGDTGADLRFFRGEQAGSELLALPKKNYTIEPVYLESGKATKNMLRVYCHRLNERVLILFSGGLKTTNDPLQCPNVRLPFLKGNAFCKAIDAAIGEDIFWNDDYSDIDCDDNFEISI